MYNTIGMLSNHPSHKAIIGFAMDCGITIDLHLPQRAEKSAKKKTVFLFLFLFFSCEKVDFQSNFLSCILTARIFLLFDLSSAVQTICFIYLHSFIHPSRVYYELTIWPAPSWLDNSVGRALHRHRRGHGLESRSSLNFFLAFFSQLLKGAVSWEISWFLAKIN